MDIGTGKGENSSALGAKLGTTQGTIVQGKAAALLLRSGKMELLMLENFIDGKFLPCHSYIDSYDPSTGEVYCKVPDSGKEEVSLFP